MKRLIFTLILVVWSFTALAMPLVPTPANGIINVGHYVPSAVDDCGPGIQAALDQCVPKGGIVFFPPRIYRITTGITIPCGNIHLVGTTGPWVKYRHTELQWHGDGPMITLPVGNTSKTGVSVTGLCARGPPIKKGESRRGIMFRVDVMKAYSSDLCFHRVGAYRFDRVLEFVSSTGVKKRRSGDVRILECAWSGNNQAIVARDVGLNTITIRDSKIRQHSPPIGKYAIDLHNCNDIRIDCNNFEGTPRALRITNSRCVRVGRLWLEQHDDTAVHLENVRGLECGMWWYHRIGEKHDAPRIRLIGCQQVVRLPMIVWHQGSGKAEEVEIR